MLGWATGVVAILGASAVLGTLALAVGSAAFATLGVQWIRGVAAPGVDGNLTMAGVTRPVKLQVTNFVCGPNPYSKKPMCGAAVQGTLKRTDFGIKYSVPGISDEVKLEIGVEAYAE